MACRRPPSAAKIATVTTAKRRTLPRSPRRHGDTENGQRRGSPRRHRGTENCIFSKPPNEVRSPGSGVRSPEFLVLSTQSSVLSPQHSALSTQHSKLEPRRDRHDTLVEAAPFRETFVGIETGQRDLQMRG